MIPGEKRIPGRWFKRNTAPPIRNRLQKSEGRTYVLPSLCTFQLLFQKRRFLRPETAPPCLANCPDSPYFLNCSISSATLSAQPPQWVLAPVAS